MADRLGSVGLADVVRYAGASGDLNPMHYDPDFARAAGHDALFAMGALHGGWLVSHMISRGAAIPEDAPWQLRLRYLGIVPLGMELTASTGPDGTTAELEGGGERKVSLLSLQWATLDEPPEPGVGRDEQRCEFPVELGSAKRFAEAVRWAAPMAVNEPVPPTYLSVLSFWLPNPDPIDRVGFEHARTLLGETTIAFTRGPLRVGETFDVREYVGAERTRSGRTGEMRLVDLVAELSDGNGLRVSYRNTFILMPPATAPAPELTGSRDPSTGEVFFPPRAVSVDGRLRPLTEQPLATEGVLYAWTTFEGTAYGQVDLDDGVRLQTKLAPGEHRIGDRYRQASSDGWFEHA
jgi:hypothetical protein